MTPLRFTFMITLINVLLTMGSSFIYSKDKNSQNKKIQLNTSGLIVLTQNHGFTNLSNDEINHFIIPLKRAGNLIVMDAIIDNITGNLIFDTGSAELVLNSIYFREGRRAQANAGGITGTTGMVLRTTIDSITISSFKYYKTAANSTDLGHIEQARNVKVLGFMGLEFFSDFEVMLDLKNNSLELFRINNWGNMIDKNFEPTNYDLEINAKVNQNVFFLDGIINRRRLVFCLDTGAESNVLGSHLPDKVLNTIQITGRSSMQGAGNQSVEVLYGAMTDFKVEKQRIENMNIIIANMNNMSNYYGLRIDGMLGSNFLEKGIFYFNLKKQTVKISFFN